VVEQWEEIMLIIFFCIIEIATSSIILNTNGRTSGSTPNMIVHTTGNVGTGTTHPSELLHLYTISTTNAFIKADASGGTGQAGLRLYAGSGTTNRSTRIDFFNINVLKWTILNDYYQIGIDGFEILNAANVTCLYIKQDGSVGIGIYNPNSCYK
jgi:hypothetical protein